MIIVSISALQEMMYGFGAKNILHYNVKNQKFKVIHVK
jgi:hypothetical protein